MNNLKPKVLCMADMSIVPEAIDILKAKTELDYFPYDYERLLEICPQYNVFWGHVNLKVDKEVMKRAERLKAINASSTKTDRIDKVEVEKRGIKILCIAKDYSLLNTFTAIAECAWMLVMTSIRNFQVATQSVLNGNWQSELFRGRQLSQPILGVLGVRWLGKMTVEYVKAFGCGFWGVI